MYLDTLKQVSSLHSKIVGIRESTLKDIERLEKEQRLLELDIDRYTRVKLFIFKVAEEAKNRLIKHIEDVVTTALCDIYGPGHKFIIELVERRNQHEVDFFIDDGNVVIPLKKPFVGKGGGKVTVTALALQIAVLEFAGNKGPLFLDEVTKCVDSEAVMNVANFLLDYSKSSGRQLVNITHHVEMAETADKAIVVEKDINGVARCRVVN